MLVGVSTGVLYPRILDLNEQIEFFRNSGLEIDGLELSFYNPKKVMALSEGSVLKLSEENECYARQMSCNTLHLPWSDADYSDTESRFLKILSELYCRLNSKVAVIHPDCVKTPDTYDFLQKLFPNLAVENMTPRKSFGYRIEDIRKITDFNENIGVVLDTAHCTQTPEPFELYESTFYQRISEIHLSAGHKYDESLMHIPLHKAEIAPVIRKRDVPLILEGRIASKEELEKELAFAKKL